MLASVPWRLVIWAFAGLCALYFLGWEAFGPPKKARRLLMNGVSGLAAAALWNLAAGRVGLSVAIGPALLASSAALGIPGAALAGALQRMLQAG